MVRSAFLNRQNFIRHHGCKQHAPVKMNNCAEAACMTVTHGHIGIQMSHSDSELLCSHGLCICLWLNKNKHRAHRECNAPMMHWGHWGCIENIALAMPVGHATYQKTNAFPVKWCWKHKTTGLKVNEFKLRESFDHFMLLVMRTYIMRTQYERKSVCFSKLSSAVLGRTHQTFLAPFIRSA